MPSRSAGLSFLMYPLTSKKKKKVFRLNIKFQDKNFDLFFQDQDTADRMIAFLNEGIVKKSDVEITITPTIEKVLSREDTIEDIIKGLSIIGMFGEN